MPFNAIRTGKNLPLSLTAWRDAYKPLANWPVQKWLQFQTLAPGSLKEGLETLHAFQEEYNIKDAPTQEYMLGWLLKATQWDKASLGSWGAWSTLLSETPMWSLATQAQLMASQAKNLLPVEPEQYDSIAKVQSQLGSYWNKVRSNISAVQGLRDHNKNSAWETYSTFRKELQLGRLLDHSNDVRWNDFCRLSKAPLAWREVLVPLYQDWVQSLPQGVVIEDTAIDQWINTLESNGVNLMSAPMPALDEPGNYHMWSVPGAWGTNDSSEKTFGRVQFLKQLTEIHGTEFMFDDYTSRSMSWALETCMNQASNWTFEQRQSLYPFFLSLCQMQKGNYFSQTRHGAYHVHQAMCDWFPEYHTELDSLKSTIQTLGLNFDKEVQDYYRTRSRTMYTGESALEELSHYTTMLAHLLAPILAKPGEDLGHLFESNEESFLGL